MFPVMCITHVRGALWGYGQVILLGDSAVGKSKLIQRFLLDDYHPRTRSTYALTLYRYDTEVAKEDGSTEPLRVDFWDTAGQERFASMHPSYYYRAHACILCFDVTRKPTYQHMNNWYRELRTYCEEIPCFVVANKIDVNYDVTKKNFAFAKKHDLPLYYVSAADGTNVVRVFQDAIRQGLEYKRTGGDFMAEVLELLDDDKLGTGHGGERAKHMLQRRNGRKE